MKIHKISHWLAAGFLGLSMLACNIGQAPTQTDGVIVETPPAGNTPATQAAPDNSNAGACGNPLLPIKVDATWTYKLTGSVSDTFTRSIVSVESNGFTDQDVFGTGVTRQGRWNCENGNLIALDPANGGSASVTTSNVTVDFQTTEQSGVTLPAAVHSGDSWTQTTTIEGTESINGVDIPAKNQFSNTCTAIGQESITVEAGTFEAMHFDCQTNMSITITMNGQDVETPLEFTASNWYAENVGLVKTVTSGSGLDGTIELAAYNIP